MNPYETPKQTSDENADVSAMGGGSAFGRACDFCGSHNTGEDILSRLRPNLILMLLFGWALILATMAFSKRTDLCRDCGQLNVYKTTGSKIALVILIAVTFLIVLAFWKKS